MDNLSTSWKEVLKEEFSKKYFQELKIKVDNAYDFYNCYPPKSYIFNAFNQCSFESVKVVILGQDPYHRYGQANGMSFAYLGQDQFPPSLKNIYKEIEDDLKIEMPKKNGNLSPWANQGILLLNTVLTVREGSPNSHEGFGWHFFANKVIEKISEYKKNIVFLLWGRAAQGKGILVDTRKHFALKAMHPSPLSSNKGGWFGCKHFSKTNEILKNIGERQIDWQLKDGN